MSNAQLKELLLEALETEYAGGRAGTAIAVVEPDGRSPRVLREALESLLAITIELEDELETRGERVERNG